MNATVFTAVVMAEGDIVNAPKVEFRLNAPLSPTKITVLVNNEVQEFGEKMTRKDFFGKTSTHEMYRIPRHIVNF